MKSALDITRANALHVSAIIPLAASAVCCMMLCAVCVPRLCVPCQRGYSRCTYRQPMGYIESFECVLALALVPRCFMNSLPCGLLSDIDVDVYVLCCMSAHDVDITV